MVEFLRNSAAIRARLSEMFSKKTRGKRRIALVAYVGAGADKLLPDYKGVELYCWPQIGATDPHTLEDLRRKKHGARIYLCEGLHIKLYWVEGIGYVVASANLSQRALGEKCQHEAGVFVDDPGSVDIASVIAGLDARPVKTKELKELQRKHDIFWSKHPEAQGKSRAARRSFKEWYKGGRLKPWKMRWWDIEGEEAPSTAVIGRDRFGVEEIYDFVGASRGDYIEGDWVLTFRVIGDRSVDKIDWLFVQYVNGLTREEIRDADAPDTHQAVQAQYMSGHEERPFSLNSGRFKTVFKSACEIYGVKKLTKRKSVHPPKELVERIMKRMK